MTTQPRKFTEKIALLNQKQAEADAAFQQIMRDVADVTSNSIARSSKKLQRSSANCGGGSLPNVNNIASHTNSPSSGSFIKPIRNNGEDHCSRVDSTTVHRERGRSVGSGSGGPMRIEKRTGTSPYSCGPYLSPPSTDLSWRRTNSDSALHQSVQSPNNTLHSPGSQRRVNVLDNRQHYDPSRTRHLSVSSDKRPRSCCEVPTSIPDINIFPSQQEPGTIQIPIGNNTGSLPDLTSFQFSSPIHTPLDQDDHQSSTYSSASPQCTSPSTLSPTSVPSRTPGRFSFGSTPPHESSGPPSYASVSPPSPSASNHLSVPHSNSAYMRKQGYLLDNSSPVESNNYQVQSQIMAVHKQQPINQQHQQLSKQMMHQQNHTQMQSQIPQYTYHQTQSPQRQSPVSPVDVSTSDSIILNHRTSLTSYRSPQSINRPSPQSSPVLNIKQYNNTSPHSSAPQSPTSSCNSVNSNNLQQSYNSHNDYYQAHENLQQHFAQIKMDWCQLLGLQTLVDNNPLWMTETLQQDSPVSPSMDYILSLANGTTNSYLQNEELCSAGANELAADQGYYSTSPLQQLPYCPTVNSAQTTPNTPCGIPDITLTDCSTTGDGTRRDAVKDLSVCDITNFLQTEDGFRDSFDSIDFQILEQLNADSTSPQF